MAIRRPSIYRQDLFVFQDFPYDEDPPTEYRYILGKFDGDPYTTVSQTFDYPLPDLAGGDIVVRVDYSVVNKLITVEHWELNWRDEWPLRLATQYLTNCLYRRGQGYSTRVAKDAYPFWVSENFNPLSNDPTDFLLKAS